MQLVQGAELEVPEVWGRNMRVWGNHGEALSINKVFGGGECTECSHNIEP